jgi:protease-4
MKEFLKYTLATIVGIIVASIIFFFFIIIIISAASQEKPVQVKPNTILYITLKESIIERAQDNPFDIFPSDGFSAMKQIGLNDILDNIEKAKKDDNISGIYLEPSYINAGMSTVEEIRNALIDFRESGKFVISYSEVYTQKAYYLASVSDKIYLNPAGELIFAGLGTQILFYKDALDKLGIEAQIIRHGTYKSAVEPFMYNQMSDENREQILVWVNTIWEHMLQGIAREREIPSETLNRLAEDFIIRSAMHAMENHLIDSLKYKDEVLSELKQLTGIKENKDLNSIPIKRYTKVPKKREYKGLAKDKVAVIYGFGNIINGNMGEGTISSERISKTIRQARRDSSIKAIVFRVNSGGGGALASEVIWRELTLTKNVKPVVASLGDVAASGGYYIISPADTIVAHPTTITGSIGVFAILPNVQKFFNKKLGIHVDVAKTNQFADFGSPFRPLTSEEKEVIRYGIQQVYDSFISHVSEGRGMTYNQVDSIGQGRVWSGINAMDNGLVDVFGGLHTAIDIAAEMAGLEKYRIVELPKLEDPFEQILRELSENARIWVLKKELGEHFKYLKQLEDLESLSGIQARLPFEVELH